MKIESSPSEIGSIADDDFFVGLKADLAEKALDLTRGQEPEPGQRYDLIRFQMPPALGEAKQVMLQMLSLGEPVCVWLMEGVFEPLETGFGLLAWLNTAKVEISYATIADIAHPKSILWPAPPAKNRLRSTAVESKEMEFSPALAGLMVPVSAELAPALLGLSLTPANYCDEKHWHRLAVARETETHRKSLDLKLQDLFNRNKPEQSAQLNGIKVNSKK